MLGPFCTCLSSLPLIVARSLGSVGKLMSNVLSWLLASGVARYQPFPVKMRSPLFLSLFFHFVALLFSTLWHYFCHFFISLVFAFRCGSQCGVATSVPVSMWWSASVLCKVLERKKNMVCVNYGSSQRFELRGVFLHDAEMSQNTEEK